MATPIDCRAYYIDSDRHVTATSNQALCQNSVNNTNNDDDDAGNVFPVSKYLIDRSRTGIEQKFPGSDNLRQDHDNVACVVDNPTDDVARNGAANAVATGSDGRISGRAGTRSVRGRLRRVACRVESLLREMKVVLCF